MYKMGPSMVFCCSSIYNLVFIISVRDCTPSLWKHYMSCTNLHWPYILQLDLHHIRKTLYYLPLKSLPDWYELTLHCADNGYLEHRSQGISLGISLSRVFKAVRFCDSIEAENRQFLKIKIANNNTIANNNVEGHRRFELKQYLESKIRPK